MTEVKMSESILKDMNFDEAVTRIQSRLKDYSPRLIKGKEYIQAAVLIPLINMEGVPHLLFTKRTELVENHKGQISFPGGVCDSGDPTSWDTALRETREEIGVSPEQVERLGQLDDFLTVTDFLIHPFAGVMHAPLNFRISKDEVAEILQVPLSLFLSDANFEIKKWEWQGKKYDVYFYYYLHHVIWGATAFILNRFIDVVFDYNPAPNPILRDPRNLHYLEENNHRGGSL